ncbi:uncharacterized protein [Anabrus simplex]|uniref:uncharacterized protein n=1 Tax=Anabrus simplex TaxID=316456 RepID=UPI0035A2F18F
MNEEGLVVLVKEYPHLYDPSHPNYHDNLGKDNSWDEISKEMGLSTDECRAKWKSLRECYRKALRKRQPKSGQAAKKINSWRLEAQMEFSRPFITMQRSQVSNVGTPSDDDEQTDISEVQEESQDVDSGSSHTIEDTQKNDKRPGLWSGKRKKTAPLTPSAAIFKEFVELKKSRQSSLGQEGDHLRKYFQSVEETVRTFPPQLQVKIKSQISTIIHQAEFVAINMQSFPAPNFIHREIPVQYRFPPSLTSSSILTHTQAGS